MTPLPKIHRSLSHVLLKNKKNHVQTILTSYRTKLVAAHPCLFRLFGRFLVCPSHRITWAHCTHVQDQSQKRKKEANWKDDPLFSLPESLYSKLLYSQQAALSYSFTISHGLTNHIAVMAFCFSFPSMFYGLINSRKFSLLTVSLTSFSWRLLRQIWQPCESCFHWWTRWKR